MERDSIAIEVSDHVCAALMRMFILCVDMVTSANSTCPCCLFCAYST